MNIDLHNHVVPPTIIDAIMRSPDRYGTKIEIRDGKRYFNVHGPTAELKLRRYSARDAFPCPG